jgi:glycosyltransferase 2 family protein
VTVLKAIDRYFRPLAVLAVVAGFGIALYTERRGIEAYPWTLSWWKFAAAVSLFAVGPLVGSAVFRILLHDLTGGTSAGISARVWHRAFLARYVPSGALTMAVRLRAREQLRASKRQVWRASLVEQLVSAIGGAAAATTAFALSPADVPLIAPLLLGVGVGIAACLPRRAATARGALLAALSWIPTGFAAWLIVSAMTPDPPGVAFVTGVYALAWLLGFVVPFVPSGLGIREAVLVGFLAPQFGVPAATLIAVTLRLANTFGDLLAVWFVEAAAAVAARRRPLCGDPTSPIEGGKPCSASS